jgi:hypothetical protein
MGDYAYIKSIYIIVIEIRKVLWSMNKKILILIICILAIGFRVFSIYRPPSDYEQRYYETFLKIKEPNAFKITSISKISRWGGNKMLAVSYNTNGGNGKDFIHGLGENWYLSNEQPGVNDIKINAELGIYHLINTKMHCSMSIDNTQKEKLELVIIAN